MYPSGLAALRPPPPAPAVQREEQMLPSGLALGVDSVCSGNLPSRIGPVHLLFRTCFLFLPLRECRRYEWRGRWRDRRSRRRGWSCGFGLGLHEGTIGPRTTRTPFDCGQRRDCSVNDAPSDLAALRPPPPAPAVQREEQMYPSGLAALRPPPPAPAVQREERTLRRSRLAGRVKKGSPNLAVWLSGTLFISLGYCATTGCRWFPVRLPICWKRSGWLMPRGRMMFGRL